MLLCVHARVFLHSHENFEGYFRRQFTRRVPYKQNPLGHEDDPVQWEDVDMMDKLEMLFHLCEWQFSGAGRLRTMMGEVDELVWVSLSSILSALFAFSARILTIVCTPPLCAITPCRSACTQLGDLWCAALRADRARLEAEHLLAHRWRPALGTTPRP